MTTRRRQIETPPEPARGTPMRLVVVSAAVAAAVVGLYWAAHQGPVGPVGFPPPSKPAPSREPVFDDFVGAEACARCHAEEYAAWAGSTHGRAGGPPSRERVIAPFNGVPIRFKDAVVTPSVLRGGNYVFTVVQNDRPARAFRVAEVVGGGFMAGGGTQAFFAKFADGTLRFLPFDYSKGANRWFCNTLGRTNRLSVPITPDIALADCGDWPPARILGSTERFQGCQQCHGSQIDVTFDSSARRYATQFTSLAINCESCHGPGRRHADLARSGEMRGADI